MTGPGGNNNNNKWRGAWYNTNYKHNNNHNSSRGETVGGGFPYLNPPPRGLNLSQCDSLKLNIMIKLGGRGEGRIK